MIRKNLISIFLIIVGLACQPFDVMDDVKISLDFDLFETFISFRYVDAETGKLIGENGNPVVELTIGGGHSEAIMTQLGEIEENYYSVAGLISLSINPFEPYIPARENPINFTVSSLAEGYKSAISSISLRDTGHYTFICPIFPENINTKNQFSIEIESGNIKEGMLENGFNIRAPNNKIFLDFPDSLELIDESGNLLSGDLELKFEWYNQLKNIPGNISEIQKIQINEEMMDAELITQSIIDINMLLNNQEKVHSFNDKTIIWKFPISDYSPADSIFIWWFDSDSDTWVFDQYADVVLEDSTYFGSVGLNHLSLYCSGNPSPTRSVIGSINFSYEKPFPEPTFLCYVKVYQMPENKHLHSFTIDMFDGSDFEFNFSIPINKGCKIIYQAINSDFSFISNPGFIEIDSKQSEFEENINLKPLNCLFTGLLKTQLVNSFPVTPVPSSLVIYNSENGSVLKTLNFNMADNTNELNIRTILPEGIPLLVELQERSLANTFYTVPDNILINESCKDNYQLEYFLNSTSCMANGQLNFQEPLGFINYPVPIFINFLRNSDNRNIHRITYNIPEAGGNYSFSLPFPMETVVRILLQDANNINYNISEDEFVWETPCNFDIEKDIQITPNFNVLSGNIHFNIMDGFNYTGIPIGIEFKNRSNNELLLQKNFTIEESNPEVTFSIPVDNDPLYMLFKRIDQNKKFIAKPFRVDLPSFNEPSGNWEIDLYPVELVFVSFTVRVVCPSGEIFPTVQGYYRIPGDSWQELNLVSGKVSGEVEFGATYEVGMIFNGVMMDSTFTVDKKEYDMTFELSQEDCEKMGWGK